MREARICWIRARTRTSFSRAARRHRVDRSGVGSRFVSVCISVHHLYPCLASYVVEKAGEIRLPRPESRCHRVSRNDVGGGVPLDALLN